jgi:hypothetical protein
VLYFAWGIEIVCIAIGFILALIIGIEAGGIGAGSLAAAPFLAAAVVEGGRIPLIHSMFASHGFWWRVLALGAVVTFSALTAENLWFGFERAFNVRIEEVRKKNEEVDAARALVAQLEEKILKLKQRRSELEEEQTRLRRDQDATDKRHDQDGSYDRTDTNAQRESLERERAAAQTRLEDHQKRAQEEMALCNRLARDRCDSIKTQERHASEATRIRDEISELTRRIAGLGERNNDDRAKRLALRDQELGKLRERKAVIERQLDELRQADERARKEIDDAQHALTVAVSDLETAVRSSQIHRFARSIFGADDTATAMKMVTIFSGVLAVVLSLAGSALALMYYRVQSQASTAPKSLVVRAVRGWIARQRRKHSVVKTVEKEVRVEVPTEKIVVKEKEVPVEVEKIVTKTIERKVEVPVVEEKIVVQIKEVPVEVERVVVKTVEVPKPELVLVPIPLDANEEMRRRILEHVRRAHGAPASNDEPEGVAAAAS